MFYAKKKKKSFCVKSLSSSKHAGMSVDAL